MGKAIKEEKKNKYRVEAENWISNVNDSSDALTNIEYAWLIIFRYHHFTIINACPIFLHVGRR